METKKCSTCKQVKRIDDFNLNNARHDGRSGKCRVCTSEYTQYYKEKRKLEGITKQVGSKVCARCNMEKPRTSYTKRSICHDGLNVYCKSCVRVLRSKWQK